VTTYTLTIRHGPRVKRQSFDSLDEALAAMEAQVEEIRAEGPLETAKLIREYEPADRVAARIELSAGGWLRGSEAGLDVMGDGSLVPYEGAIRRRALEPRPGESALEAVRQALG
jgi:hypothetical protein